MPGRRQLIARVIHDGVTIEELAAGLIHAWKVRKARLDGGYLRQGAGQCLDDALADGIEQLPVVREIPTQLLLEEHCLRGVVGLIRQPGVVANTEEARRPVTIEVDVAGRSERPLAQAAELILHVDATLDALLDPGHD